MSRVPNNDDLAKCPLCGGEAIYSQIVLIFEAPGDVRETVKCTSCGLTVDAEFGQAKGIWNAKRDQEEKVGEANLCPHF